MNDILLICTGIYEYFEKKKCFFSVWGKTMVFKNFNASKFGFFMVKYQS